MASTQGERRDRGRRRSPVFVCALLLILAACSGGSDQDAHDESADEAVAAPAKHADGEADEGDQPDRVADADAAAESDGSDQAASPDQAPIEPLAPGESFIEDFTGDDALSHFEFSIFHRDDYVVLDTAWPADHPMTGLGDLCGPPAEKREVNRGERSSGFNDEWIYRCVPGGDLAKAHIMTSIGDTSGYSIGSFTPRLAFEGVREVRWDVNQTDLGDRQWTEVSIIPADHYDPALLPCTSDVPCDTTTHDAIGSVGVQWAGQRTRRINTWEMPDGYLEAGGGLGYRCEGCPYAPSKRFGESYGAADPALTSIEIRRENYFRDNGDGTLTWGFQLDDGSFEEFTAPGSFPSGPVRVVFKDHNYTPTKSPATLLADTTFTWHWDNIVVRTDAAEEES